MSWAICSVCRCGLTTGGVDSKQLARAGRLHNLDARLLFTRAHIALRQTLSRYALIPAQDWIFEIGQYGRPEISNLNAPKGPRFNFSHTPGMIAIIIHCSFNAGLDVEGIGRVVDHSAMSRICFSAAERDALLALPVEEQPLRFAQTWALKESLVKAMGTGLTTPLKSFSFDLPVPDAIGFNCSSDIDKNPSAWSFSLNRPTDYHVLATATRIE